MIQGYQNDPLLHNYLAPSYPIFIQLKSLILGLATKKSTRNIRPDLLFVTPSPRSSPASWAPRANASSLPPSSRRSTHASSARSRRPA
jgi:hypothetical protein